ncbi:NAC domain-containing protein 2-like protein [Cinnamomum micranthum f. kanehirae]|uniref:NAC domain-containing protein 2-like protein n=1 Tax=Cinnamomum micranthum f. kanehirae TaxID=337451 RepID=A0A3S3Q779_9MAGN|nr:NAC domain-containing protein 2-like protein [Cinnamomum micranthum f. kanehirae]
MMMTPSAAMMLPWGFRFLPTDEELLIYLRTKILSLPLPCNVIEDIELYNYHPSQIGGKGEEDDNKRYFFTRLVKKYENGERPSRAVKNGGHWKATTGDKTIRDSRNNKLGFKKSLVFIDALEKKTNWLMQEYRIDEHRKNNGSGSTSTKKDQWVLCCIYEKINAKEKKQRKEKKELENNQHDDQEKDDVVFEEEEEMPPSDDEFFEGLSEKEELQNDQDDDQEKGDVVFEEEQLPYFDDEFFEGLPATATWLDFPFT